MWAALRAGFVYFAVVFAIGFLLGVIRALVVAPRFGETGGVLIELPIMILASWFICERVLDRLCVPATWRSRMVMGATAFGLLIVAELAVSVLGFGRSISDHFETYRTWSARLGPAAQLAFAAMPLTRRRRAPV